MIFVCPSLNGMLTGIGKPIVGPKVKNAGKFHDALRVGIAQRFAALTPCETDTWELEVPEAVPLIEGGVGICLPHHTASHFVRRQLDGTEVWCLKRAQALPIDAVRIRFVSSPFYLKKVVRKLPGTIPLNEGVVRQSRFVITRADPVAKTESRVLVNYAELALRYGSKNKKMPPALIAECVDKLVLVADG